MVINNQQHQYWKKNLDINSNISSLPRQDLKSVSLVTTHQHVSLCTKGWNDPYLYNEIALEIYIPNGEAIVVRFQPQLPVLPSSWILLRLKKSDNLQYNTLGRWVDGTFISSTKRLMFQVFFFSWFLAKIFQFIFQFFYNFWVP